MYNITDYIPGPSGLLEIQIRQPEQLNDYLMIACHPNTKGGGTMQNKVVSTTVKVANQLGMIGLAFNFRGAGNSQGKYNDGHGEVQDLLAVIAWCRQAYSSKLILVSGFSFGAYVSLNSVQQLAISGLVLIAPPVNLWSFKNLSLPTFPTYIIHGQQDTLVPLEGVEQWLTPSHLHKLTVIEHAGHFFHGQLIPLRKAVKAKVKQIIES